MKLSEILLRADQLVASGQQVVATQQGSSYGRAEVASGPMKAFRVGVLSFIDRVYGRTHPHFSEFESLTEYNYATSAVNGLAVIQAIRDEIAGGWLFTVKGLVTAEIFADFLEMAEYLLVAGYKDPAAVMAGSVLEEHLRQLCTANAIDVYKNENGKQVPVKADGLNAELAREPGPVYSKLDQKQITAWLGLRNDAAHGDYGKYTHEQVKLMLSGITDFMVRVSI